MLPESCVRLSNFANTVPHDARYDSASPSITSQSSNKWRIFRVQVSRSEFELSLLNSSLKLTELIFRYITRGLNYPYILALGSNLPVSADRHPCVLVALV